MQANKAWRALLITLKREKLISVANIVIMTITFLVLGAFVTVFVTTQTALKQLEDQAQITVFFKDTFPEENIMSLEDELRKDERILDVRYVSKEQAFKIFTEINKDEPVLLESLSASILPASIEVRATKVSDLSVLAQEFSIIDGVEEVKFFEDVIDRFRYWGQVVNVVGLALVTSFLFISFSIVLLTLRMTINSKGTELEILKLVGASDSYVKLPLMLQGVFFGIVSALVASLILVPVFYFGVANGLLGGRDIVFLTILPALRVSPLVYSVILSLGLLFSGFLLGYVGSHVALRKYLRY